MTRKVVPTTGGRYRSGLPTLSRQSHSLARTTSGLHVRSGPILGPNPRVSLCIPIGLLGLGYRASRSYGRLSIGLTGAKRGQSTVPTDRRIGR